MPFFNIKIMNNLISDICLAICIYKNCVFSLQSGKSKLILLIDIKIDQPEDNSKIFKITNLQKKNSKEKIFQTETEVECQQWMEAIIDAKLELKEKHQGNSEACSIQ